jgi:hypothetical protein
MPERHRGVNYTTKSTNFENVALQGITGMHEVAKSHQLMFSYIFKIRKKQPAQPH